MFKEIMIMAMLLALLNNEFPSHDMVPLLIMSALAIGIDLLLDFIKQ